MPWIFDSLLLHYSDFLISLPFIDLIFRLSHIFLVFHFDVSNRLIFLKFSLIQLFFVYFRFSFLTFQALRFLRVTVPKTPLVRNLLPAFAYKPENGGNRGLQNAIPPMADQFSLTRIFCGALFFPTIASFLGATLYKNVPSQLKRTLLGGATFALVKGVLKIYHKQHSYIRQCQKQIMDYTE